MSATVEIRQYVNAGRLITAMVPVDAMTETKYSGMYQIPTPHGMMRQEFEFPTGLTLEECFEKFEETAKQDFTNLQEEAQKEAAAQKLWTPGSKGGLVVPK